MMINTKTVKLLNKLFQAGYTDEKSVTTMSMDDILELPGINVFPGVTRARAISRPPATTTVRSLFIMKNRYFCVFFDVFRVKPFVFFETGTKFNSSVGRAHKYEHHQTQRPGAAEPEERDAIIVRENKAMEKYSNVPN